MPHSIEQGKEIHKARRVLKLIAPDFRIVGRNDLQAYDCVLDMKAKTIEISEHTPELHAVAGILFQIGHLRLRADPDFKEHLGQIVDVGEKRLIKRLVDQGVKADEVASKWAKKVFSSNWDVSDKKSSEWISTYVWGDTEWRDHYTAQ